MEVCIILSGLRTQNELLNKAVGFTKRSIKINYCFIPFL